MTEQTVDPEHVAQILALANELTGSANGINAVLIAGLGTLWLAARRAGFENPDDEQWADGKRRSLIQVLELLRENPGFRALLERLMSK